jgi:hypothetical protein
MKTYLDIATRNAADKAEAVAFTAAMEAGEPMIVCRIRANHARNQEITNRANAAFDTAWRKVGF